MVARVPVKAQEKAVKKRAAASRAAKPAPVEIKAPKWPFGKSEVTLSESDWPKAWSKLRAQVDEEHDAEIESLHANIKALLDERDALRAENTKFRQAVSTVRLAVDSVK